MKAKELKIGEIYLIKNWGKCLYMGRLGFEFNVDMKGIKGINVFRSFKFEGTIFIALIKKKIETDVDIITYKNVMW
jgi:hypothetical protein